MGTKVEPIGDFSRTQRGFGIVKFKDGYGYDCTIQQSSSAMGDFLWIGVDNAQQHAQVMAVHARHFGIQTDQMNGWVEYPIPKEVMIPDRMHLERKDVRRLVKLLNNWLRTGELGEDPSGEEA